MSNGKITITVEAGSMDEVLSILGGALGQPTSQIETVEVVESKVETRNGRSNGVKVDAKKKKSKVRAAKPEPEAEPEEEEEEDEDEDEDEDDLEEDDDDEEGVDEDTALVAKLASMTRLRDVLTALVDSGYDDVDNLVNKCVELKSSVPVLKKVSNLEERVKRASEVLGL